MKTSINLGDKTKYVGWGSIDSTNCLDLCKTILKKYGLTNFGSSSNVYQLKYEKDNQLIFYGNNPKENYEKAIQCIDNHLENGRPIIVGVNHTLNRGINEGATDHFVVIYGRGFDGTYQYYNYYEVGKSNVTDGYNDETNRFIYDPESPDFYNKISSIKNGCRFDVTQIRPNDGSII